MKFRTHADYAAAPAGPAGGSAADAAASTRRLTMPGPAARVLGVLLLIAAVAAGLAHFRDPAALAGADARTTLPAPRDRDLIDGIRQQVRQMTDRGMIAAIHDGDPTVVVVTDVYLASASNLRDDLPLYGGHYVGFAGEYAWLVNGTHNVRLVHEDGTELGRRTGPLADEQVQAIYRENRRRMDSATAGLTDPRDE